MAPNHGKIGCARGVIAAFALAAMGWPVAAQTPPATADEWTYAVQRGDTLIGISWRLLDQPRQWRALQKLNRVAEPRRLQPGSTLRIPLAWLGAEAAVAEVTEVAGEVQLRSADGSTSGARDGSTVRSRDTVVTAAAGSAVLRLADGSTVLLTPGTRLVVQDLLRLRGTGAAAATLQLQQGGAESQVRREAPRPRFEIRTPVLNLGARGTEFRARHDPASQRTLAEVTQGSVAAAAAGRGPQTLLEPGFGVVATPAGPAPATPLLPAPELSTLAARFERLPLRLAWPGVGGAAAWQLQVFEGDRGQRLVHEQRTAAPAASIGDLPDGRYRLRLRAADAQGLEGRAAEVAFAVKARPEPPFLREPAPSAAQSGTRVRFLWVLSSAAARYKLQLARSADFAAPVHDLADLAGPGHELELDLGTWHWRLASVRADGDSGPWSDGQTFELRPPPPPPPPSAPAMTEPPKADAGRLVLRWAAGKPGDRFQFQLAGDPGFAAPAIDRTVDEPQAALESPPPGRYHVRSRTIDANGTAGPWSAASEFEVPRSLSWWWLAPLVLVLLLL